MDNPYAARTNMRYSVSFRLNKYEFLKDRKQYVGHDMTLYGNCPAQSKCNMINNGNQPVTGKSLFPFVGLINFHHQSTPYLELKLKPLNRLCCAYYRQPIPMIA